MPIYEYRRPDGTTFEMQQSFSDDPLKVDPDTGVPVERVLHAPAVHFKGKGFYNTDYGTRKRNRETAAAADSSGNDKSTDSKSGEKSSGPEKSSGSAAGEGAASGSGGKGPAEGSKGKAADAKAAKAAGKG